MSFHLLLEADEKRRKELNAAAAKASGVAPAASGRRGRQQ